MINFYNQQNRNGQDNMAIRSKDAEVKNDQANSTLKKDIKGYQSQNSVGAKGLKFGIWFTTHKVLLYRIALILFIIFDAVVIIFSLWKIGGFLYYDLTRKDQMERELAYFANNVRFRDVDKQ